MSWNEARCMHTQRQEAGSLLLYILLHCIIHSITLFFCFSYSLYIKCVYVCVLVIWMLNVECGVKSASLVVYIFIQFKNLCSSFLIISIHPSIHPFIHLIFTIVCCLRICWRWKREIPYHMLVLKHLFYKPTLSWLPSSLLNPSTSISI